MNFIHKYIPQNPINATTQKKITDTVAEVLEKFAKNYATQTQLTIVHNKEQEIIEKRNRQIFVEFNRHSKIKSYKKKYGDDADIPDFPDVPEPNASLESIREYCFKMFKLGFKPMRPRGRYEVKMKPDITTYICGYFIRDLDYDPYCVYIVSSRKGNLIALKERRFTEFSALHKAIKKFVPKDLAFPAASSKIGKRNLTPDFLNGRTQILNTYLKAVVQIKDLENNEVLLKFLGLLPSKDPLDDQIFSNALRQTKWDLWNWDDIVYDTPEEAMTKLLTKEIFRAVNSDIVNALPTAEGPRKASKKVAFKAISAVINKAVPPAWKTAYEVNKKIREQVVGVLSKVIDLILENKEKINKTIKEKLFENINPVKDGLNKVITGGFQPLAPVLVKPFAPIVKTYNTKVEKTILEAFQTNDNQALDSAFNFLIEAYNQLMESLGKALDDALSSISSKLKGEFTIKELGDFFEPIGKLNRAIENLVRLLNPNHWGLIMKYLIKHKKKLEENENGNIDRILNDMEIEVYNEIYYESWRIELSVWDARSSLNNLDLPMFGETCFKTGNDINENLFIKVMLKLLYKFSDYVWGCTITENDKRSWVEKINDAFEKAYRAARHKFVKEVGKIILSGTDNLIEKLIISNVTKLLDTFIKPVISPLESALPESIKNMVNLSVMLSEDIHDVLERVINDILCMQGDSLLNILETAVSDIN